MMFRGVNVVNLDAKGRMALPTRYRALLQPEGGQLVVTIDTDERCLLMYPLTEWERIEQKIEALPSFHPLTRRVQRLLIGYATEVEMDSQGRLLLPSLLREYAGLDKRLMLVGQGKKFELWDEGRWQSRRDEWLEQELFDPEEMPEDLRSLSL